MHDGFIQRLTTACTNKKSIRKNLIKGGGSLVKVSKRKGSVAGNKALTVTAQVNTRASKCIRLRVTAGKTPTTHILIAANRSLASCEA